MFFEKHNSSGETWQRAVEIFPQRKGPKEFREDPQLLGFKLDHLQPFKPILF